MSQTPLDKKIVAYCCEHSAGAAADLAGREGHSYPAELQIIRVPCAGRIDVIHILKALENGAAAVLVMGCENGACHHRDGNERARQRVENARALLKEAGLSGPGVTMFNLAPNVPYKFVQMVNSISDRLSRGEPL